MQQPANEIPCCDCGTLDMPMDSILTGKQWEMICPEQGMLCASCIVRRAAKLPGVCGVNVRIIFDESYGDGPGGSFFAYMKKLDGEVYRDEQWVKDC